MAEKAFQSMKGRLKDRQIGFYAFLNKQFNVMNYKAARCSMHCFDSQEKSVAQVNECLGVCRQGITECRAFAMDKQQEAQASLTDC